MRRRSLIALAGAAVPAAGLWGRRSSGRARWAHSWVAMPQLTEPNNMPPAPYAALENTTLRQTAHLTLGGSRLRVRFSNAYGLAPLPLTGASVGRPAGGRPGVPGASGIVPLTFGGRPSVVVPVGAQIVSDPVPLAVAAGADLTVSVYLAAGQAGGAITSHPGSRTTSYLATGDQHGSATLTGATPVDHWYLLSGIEVHAPAAPGLAIVGDSLTDGRGSTTNGNDRWPDRLFARRPRLAVLNQAAGGNRVLNDGLGPNVLARFDRDVLATSGVDRVLVFEGVNDIGTAPATDEAQAQVTADLLMAYHQLVLRAHALDLPLHGATLTPFGGNEGYDDPAGLRERSRRTVNAALPGIVDEVADFDAAVRDPGDPRRLRPSFDTGDHLHLNPAGYAALAAAVPIRLLT